MKDFHPYKWGIRVGGMVVFLLSVTAAVVTLNCSVGTKACDKELIDSLWKDSLVGSLALIAATAGQVASEAINKGSQTSVKPRTSTRARPLKPSHG